MADMGRPASIQFTTPSELLLLQAALLEGSGAAEAAKCWLAQQNGEVGPGFHGLESGSRRLLPLLYRNVKASLPAKLQAELRKLHHEYWAANQKRFRRLQELLAWFEENGIPTLVLKGMALSVLHYRDMAVRPMSDLDILVPEDRAPEVVSRLERDGWIATYFLPSAPRQSYFYRHVHALPLNHPDHGDLDLHWHVLSEATFREADRPFWKDSVPLEVNEIKTRALNPTDQLIHACVHGFRSNVVAPIRWIADAVTILRTSQVDWTRLVNLAKELHVTVPLGASLSFLRATFPTPIPADLVGELQGVLVDHAERRYFDTLVHQHSEWRDVLAYNLERHRRANQDRNPILRIASLPRQLQLHYNLPHLKDLGTFAFSRLGKRIKRIGHS
jgi:Uncharacterised nucleotidyltransferase